MNRILILFAHPRYEKSRINRSLLEPLAGSDGTTIHDLYEHYPDFNIDVESEKSLLLEHDIIIWQHPLYMYSSPAMMKQWIDMVLEFGWAHGAGVDNLKGKVAFNAVTAGGTRESYGRAGFNRYSMQEFLYPFEQTARLCKMEYLPPFAVQGTYRLSEAELSWYAALYKAMLDHLSHHGISEDMHKKAYMNDWFLDKHGRKGP
jgi:glutathione-regulated potassium-efflux system ancillary protein KefG